MATGIAIRWRRDARCRQCTGSDCRTHFGRPSTRRGCRICVTVRLPVQPRGETMYWQANANTPLSVTPLLNVPYISACSLAGPYGKGKKKEASRDSFLGRLSPKLAPLRSSRSLSVIFFDFWEIRWQFCRICPKTSPQTSPRTAPLQNANFAQNFVVQKPCANVILLTLEKHRKN